MNFSGFPNFSRHRNGHRNLKGYRRHLSEDPIGDRLSENQIGDHLSENQINEHLIGDLAAPSVAHLAACELCESRVARAAAPIEAFKAVTVAWSERRSATLPLHQTLARSAAFHPRLAWAAALAAALAIGAAIPLVTHQQRQETARIQAPSQAAIGIAGADARVSSNQNVSDNVVRDNSVRDNSVRDNSVRDNDNIARDNQMLKAIDRELDASVGSPAMLGLQPVSGTAAREPAHPSSVQD